MKIQIQFQFANIIFMKYLKMSLLGWLFNSFVFGLFLFLIWTNRSKSYLGMFPNMRGKHLIHVIGIPRHQPKGGKKIRNQISKDKTTRGNKERQMIRPHGYYIYIYIYINPEVIKCFERTLIFRSVCSTRYDCNNALIRGTNILSNSEETMTC